MAVLEAKYQQLAKKPPFKALQDLTQTWHKTEPNSNRKRNFRK
jgi:hypothetical protein